MAKGGNSPGLSKLAALMAAIAKGQVPGDLVLDFAEIKSNKSLLPNSFSIEIPKEAYLILDGAEVSIGDHVLIGWVGNDAIVLGKIQEASDVL